MLRLGVVGCGAIHGTHCEAAQRLEGARLAVVYDTDHARACLASERFGVPAARSWRALMEGVDAVILGVPSGYHSKVGIAAARSGKHVLCEKPIDVSLSRAEALVKECRARGVTLSVVSQHRFCKAIQRARQAAQSGELGQLLQGDAAIKWYRTQAYYDQDAWRGTRKLDGGCLMNQGIHYVDMIQWIMGGVQSVQAVTRTIAHRMEMEDQALALLEYRNGAIGVLQATTCAYPGLAERLEVHGRHGSIVIEGDRVKLWEVDPAAEDGTPYGRGVMQQPTPSVHVSTTAPDEDDPTAKWGEQHRLQMQDWVSAILESRESFLTGEMALEPLRVVLAVYRSARLGGRRVQV